MDRPITKYATTNGEVDIGNVSVNGKACNIKAQGIYMRSVGVNSPEISQNIEKKELTHKDKLCGYVQTSGQLGGALGLVVSGLFEGNFARMGLGGFNAFRSSTKLISDFNAKSNKKSHRNDVAESSVATGGNSVGFLNIRSPEELMAVCMGVTAWATKGITSFIHMRCEGNAEKRQQDIHKNNLFFSSNTVEPQKDDPKPRVQGLIHRGVEMLKDKALESTFMVMSHAPPLMMTMRAASYLIDGINNNDLAMAGGGASFIVGATLMAIKDHRSYMKARAERKEEKGLKEKAREDFKYAEKGKPVTFLAEMKPDGNISARWGLDLGEMDGIIKAKVKNNPNAYKFETVTA